MPPARTMAERQFGKQIGQRVAVEACLDHLAVGFDQPTDPVGEFIRQAARGTSGSR
jgi:hypothetical protein